MIFISMTEDELQMHIVQWLDASLPMGSVVHHSPNEGRRHVAYKVRLKKLGMAAGWPDLRLSHVEAYLKPLLKLRQTGQANLLRQLCEAQGG
jgi:hypothetical protein